MRSLLAQPQPICPSALVIQPATSLDEQTVMQFHQQMHAAIASHHPVLVVDMQHVEQMNSAGLMALVTALKLAQKFDKQLSFCSLSHSVRMILELTQLDRVLQIV